MNGIRTLKLVVVLVVIAVMPSRLAWAAADSGLYAGAGVGISNLEPETNGTIYAVDKKRDFAWKLFLGYRLNDDINIEAYYSDLGEVTLSPSGQIAYQDMGVSAMYYFSRFDQFNKPINLFVRAGVGTMQNQANINYDRRNTAHLMLGLGLEYPIDKQLAVRADLDLYDYDAQFVSVNLVYRFGNKPVQASEPPQVQVTPPPPETAPIVKAPADTDGDGVNDENDQCPGTPAGEKVDAHGCKLDVVINLKGVKFKSGSAEIVADSSSQLDEVAGTLQRYPQLKIEVAGHTDSRGNSVYNRKLSQQRADAVRRYLIGKAIAADRMTAKGYGEDKPIADNHTQAGRAENRRVEIHILQ